MPTYDPENNLYFLILNFVAYLKVVVAKKKPFFQKRSVRFRDDDSVH